MITLKGIKYAKFASQETHCYEATLYLNGRKVGHVSNDGHGGGDNEYFNNPECRAAVEKYIYQVNHVFDSDTEKAAEIRNRIKSLVRFNDDGFCENDAQETDEVLCRDFSHVLDIKWLQKSLESICCDLVNEHLNTKEVKRLLKNRVLHTKKGNSGLFQTQCANSKASLDHWISQTVADQTTDVCLNTLPIEQAIAVFQERTS